MRSDVATIIAFGMLSVCLVDAQPTYSCFDPPQEGMTNPLGEGMEDVVEAECCEALIDEGDMMSDRKVMWDSTNCNFGPGTQALAEAPLCRAHDTDGCRFCRDSCEGFAGLCTTCDEIAASTSESPTPAPDSEATMFPGTPAPTTVMTDAPFGIFPTTPAPVAATEAPVAATVPIAPTDEECECVSSLSEEELAVLERRSKKMVCDPTCTDNSDLIWGVLNCNYFALGQNCRTCSDVCIDQGSSVWLDQDGAPCKPCSAI